MTVNNVEISGLHRAIKVINYEITKLMDSCPHEHGTYEYHGGGNYPDGDVYWADWRCTDCGTKRMVDSERDPDEYCGLGSKDDWVRIVKISNNKILSSKPKKS
jgi:hypothetical protein